MKTYHYILDGKTPKPQPDITEWTYWMENADRVIKKTDLPYGAHISTIFLGIDHSFKESTPILFATVIFGGDHDGYRERYSTWEEAVAGHERCIKMTFEVN